MMATFGILKSNIFFLRIQRRKSESLIIIKLVENFFDFHTKH